MRDSHIKFKIFSWQTWPYLVRGIASATIIFVLFAILFFFFDHSEGNVWDWFLVFVMFPFAFVSAFNGTAVFSGILEQFILYMFLGACFGWFYGKIKNRKSASSLNAIR